MSRAHRLTLVLTEPQYEALASAVAVASTEMEDGDSGSKADLAVLQRAWARVNQAWYAPTPAARHE